MENKKDKEKVAAPSVGKTKYVRNRSGHRVELLIDNKTVVFLPGKATKVPADFEVPNGLGLYVK